MRSSKGVEIEINFPNLENSDFYASKLRTRYDRRIIIDESVFKYISQGWRLFLLLSIHECLEDGLKTSLFQQLEFVPF